MIDFRERVFELVTFHGGIWRYGFVKNITMAITNTNSAQIEINWNSLKTIAVQCFLLIRKDVVVFRRFAAIFTFHKSMLVLVLINY